MRFVLWKIHELFMLNTQNPEILIPMVQTRRCSRVVLTGLLALPGIYRWISLRLMSTVRNPRQAENWLFESPDACRNFADAAALAEFTYSSPAEATLADDVLLQLID